MVLLRREGPDLVRKTLGGCVIFSYDRSVAEITSTRSTWEALRAEIFEARAQSNKGDKGRITATPPTLVAWNMWLIALQREIPWIVVRNVIAWVAFLIASRRTGSTLVQPRDLPDGTNLNYSVRAFESSSSVRCFLARRDCKNVER